MAKGTTSRYTMAEIRKMIAKGDYWPTAPDVPEIELDEDFWRNAKLIMPKPTPGPAPKSAKEAISLRVGHDILAWFRAQGRGYQSRMNAVLRAYVESQRTASDRQQ